MKAGSTNWRQFGTARSMQESQNQVIYQVSTICSHGKDTQRKRILESQLQRSGTSESSLARFIKTILTNRPRLLLLSTPRYWWLDWQSRLLSFSNKSEDELANSTNKRAKKNRAAFDFYRVFVRIWVTYMFDILSHNICDYTWLYVTSVQSSLKFLSRSRLPCPFKFQSSGVGFLPRTPPGSGGFSSMTFHQYLSLNNHQLIPCPVFLLSLLSSG